MATPIPANRCGFSAEEIIRATGAQPLEAARFRTAAVSIDTRSITPGAL